jgi:autotransporter-associated beta strand protein
MDVGISFPSAGKEIVGRMRKPMHSFWHSFSPKFALRLSLLLTGLVCAFPTANDAAKAGGGTTTTMVLTYAYGAPPRWVARIDPLEVQAFQLDFMFNPDRAQLVQSVGENGVIFKFPFNQGPVPPDFTGLGMGRLLDVSGNTAATSPGDVDIFELVFIDLQPGQPIDNVAFTVFASSNDSIVGFDPVTLQTVTFNSTQIAPTTRTVTTGVSPHIWDPDALYNNGHTGGPGIWDTSSNSWDDLPSLSQPLVNTPWNNGTHANDIAVFGGNPGSGIVTLAGPIAVGGFQFDISGYHIQDHVVQLSAPPGLTPIIDTGANNARIGSIIVGSNGLTKVGTGTLELTGANGYSGTTTINAGTLLLSNTAGSGTGSSLVMVNSGGTLGGTGAVGGPVNVDSGATLMGGNGLTANGALTLLNHLNLSPGSIIRLALGVGGSHSTLNRAGGNWNFDPNQSFNFISLGAQPGFYDNIITGLVSDPGTGSWTISNPGFSGTFFYDGAGNIDLNITAVPCTPAFVTEVEPNNTSDTAQAVAGSQVRLRGDLYRFPLPAVGDEDFYSFAATAGDRVYAATMTSFSAGSTDTVIDIIGSDGVTILETDDDDGSILNFSSSIAGTLIPVTGTYYIRVRPFIAMPPATLGGTVRPYDLYLRVQSGAPMPEAEPNNNGGTPNPLPPNGWAGGAVNPASDNDTFSFFANAGDTIYTSLDPDPERDGTTWNPRLGLILGGNLLLVNDASITSPNSEAFMMTAPQSGTYVVYVDSSGATTMGTYFLSVSVVPRDSCRTCTNYAGPSGPINDLGTTDFTLNIPDLRLIDNLRLNLNSTHPQTADLDVSLISPDGNEVVLFDDPPTGAGVPAPQINCALDDEAALPIAAFNINNVMEYQPEFFARLGYFKGMQAQGTWTLRVRDDLGGNLGALNSWSLTVCEDPPAPCTDTLVSIYSSDFESNDGGFTHSGTQDEWERGLPSAASAPITTCHSGTNCWKTDRIGPYNPNSDQDLLAPAINAPFVSGFGKIGLTWWQKSQMDSASSDTAYVEVREVGVPSNFKRVWEWKGATQTRSVGNPVVTAQVSAGWGLMQADISSFAGKMIEVRFHLESNATTQLSGLAIDDVEVKACTVATPLQLTSAVSRKTHGPEGDFDVPLPPSAPFGVECRSGGAGGNHLLVITFTNPVVSGSANMTTGTGSVSGSPVFAGNIMTVDLTGVTDEQLITVTLSGVTDSFAQVLPDTPVSAKILLGDTTSNSTVNAGDIGQTKGQSGNPTGLGNFRNDTNLSGSINAGDIGQVKASSGNSVP